MKGNYLGKKPTPSGSWPKGKPGLWEIYDQGQAVKDSGSLGDPLWDSAGQLPIVDFPFSTNKNLTNLFNTPDLITFTRASTATYVGSDGLIKTAVTNLLLRSEEFENASWTKQSSVSVSPNTTVSPNGTLTADTITWTSASVGTGIYTQILSGLAASVTHTRSIYVRADSAGGAVELADPVLTTGITTINLTTEWQRIQLSEDSTVSGGAGVWIRKTANSPNTIYLWGAQLEQASTVGDYVPTTSTINSAPRFDHNPTTGESLGLLVEEARTNLLLNSAALSTQSVTVAAAANTLSFYGTGTVTLTGVSTAGPLVGTGANNRVSLTFTPTVGVLVLTVSGSVTNAQLEAGAVLTSYIPTTTATVTRAADVATITGTNFSSWYNQTEGTVFVDAISVATNTSVYGISDNTTSNRIQLETGSNTRRFRITSSGAARYDNSVSYTFGTQGKTAGAYLTTNANHATNGTLGSNSTASPLPVVDRMYIGSSAVGAIHNNGPIKRLSFWPTRLSNEVLQRITQP